MKNQAKKLACWGGVSDRVHLAPEKFENAVVSFMRIGIRSFSKTLFKREEIVNAGFSFLCGIKTFCKRTFSSNTNQH